MILLQIFTHIRCVRNKSVLREERVDLFAGRHGRGRARKHLAWYLRGVPYSGYYKEKISSISTVEDVQRLAAGIRRDLR